MGHGTSGQNANHAPSNYRNLFDHFRVPFQLALQGYVVVATDYAGLGVSKDASGAFITHEYLACPSQANDLIHSVTAARAAFPELSEQFVVVGHSQGGGAAWAVAQKVAITPIPGYLGAVAIAPYTDLLKEESEFGPVVAAVMCRGIASAFPDFDVQEILTPEGEKRIKVMCDTDAGLAAGVALLLGADVVKPAWKRNFKMQEFSRLTSNGGKAIQGPLLVIHGNADERLSLAVCERAVKKTAGNLPSAQLDFVKLPGVSHTTALPASQSLWMDRIADRFAGRDVAPGCQNSTLTSARQSHVYHKEEDWYLEPATQFYQTP